MLSEKRRGRNPKLQQGKYQLRIKTIQVTMKFVKYWNRLSREAEESPFGDFQSSAGVAGKHSDRKSKPKLIIALYCLIYQIQ